jgi:hypothetical protein
MTTTTNILTVRDTVVLAAIVEAAIHNLIVARHIDEVGVVKGKARSIGDKAGNHASNQDDVRDCFLRVTTNTGFEAFWPVRELISEVHSGHFLPRAMRP